MKRARTANQELLFNEPASDSVITDIQPVKRDPNLRQVKIGKRIAATLPAGDVEALRLVAGTRWSDALAKRVQAAVYVHEARRDAMRLLSARPLSRKELTDRLTKRGYDSAIVKNVVDAAVRDGWLNEKAYADDIVRGVTSRRPAGKRLVEEKLRSRGLDEAVVRDVMARTAKSQDARAEALKLARRRLATMKGVSPEASLRRLAGLLARRGFDEDIVHATLDAMRLIMPDRENAG